MRNALTVLSLLAIIGCGITLYNLHEGNIKPIKHRVESEEVAEVKREEPKKEIKTIAEPKRTSPFTNTSATAVEEKSYKNNQQQKTVAAEPIHSDAQQSTPIKSTIIQEPEVADNSANVRQIVQKLIDESDFDDLHPQIYEITEDNIVISVWSDGIMAEMILLDYPNKQNDWQFLVASLCQVSSALKLTYDITFGNKYHSTIMLLNDINKDNTILTIFDGVVIADYFS